LTDAQTGAASSAFRSAPSRSYGERAGFGSCGLPLTPTDPHRDPAPGATACPAPSYSAHPFISPHMEHRNYEHTSYRSGRDGDRVHDPRRWCAHRDGHA
jgi:hypothetical protein